MPHMKIAFETDASDATKAYADGCWRENPRISPDSWRLSHGWTVGKLWADGRDGVLPEVAEAWAAGMNGVLVTPESWPQWRDVLARFGRESVVTGCVAAAVDEVPEGVDFALWRWEARDDAAWRSGFAGLEFLVQQGRLAGYGVALGENIFDISGLWPAAQAAAAGVWGRRKRPAWRMLSLPLGIGARAWLEDPVCALPEGGVSGLEWAARQDFLVLAEGADAVLTPAGDRVEENAVAVDVARVMGLMVVATEAEVALMQALRGWLQRGGVAVFSLMGHIQAGMPLWPGVGSHRRWREAVWPDLAALWRQVAGQRPELAGLIGNYMQELEALNAHGAAVAGVGAVQWRERLVAGLRERTGWQHMPVTQLAAGVVAGIPAVTAVLGCWGAGDVRALMETPSCPDVGRVLGYVHGGC